MIDDERRVSANEINEEDDDWDFGIDNVRSRILDVGGNQRNTAQKGYKHAN